MQPAEDLTLKAHVDSDGAVWCLKGDGLPHCSGEKVAGFLAHGLGAGMERARVIGCASNVSLVLGLYQQKKKGGLASLEVASPLACSVASHLTSRPESVLFDMRRWSDSPSRGGWHEVVELDCPPYCLAEMLRDGATWPQLSYFLQAHPSWPEISLIPHLDLHAVCELVATILDPRFYVSAKNPDRLSGLESYLGLWSARRRSPRSRSSGLAGSRYSTVLRCWKGVEPEGAQWDKEAYFIWRTQRKHRDSGLGDVRASQKFLAYLRHTWMDSLYRGNSWSEPLFVPEFFFTDREAMWFRESLRRLRA